MGDGTLRDLAGASAACMAIQGKASREVQGVAAGDRISGTGSVGLPECLTSPGRRYSDMSACVCLYSVTDSQDQDSTEIHTQAWTVCPISEGRARDRPPGGSTTGVTDAEVMSDGGLLGR